MKILCVLRSGGIYTEDHVYRLQEQVSRNVTLPYDFVCLTDLDIPCSIPLENNFKGWWSKLELFRFNKALYFDLDITIQGNIDDIVSHPHEFSICRDFIFPECVNSSVMAWDGDYKYLYEKFRESPSEHENIHSRGDSWGDQGFIQRHLKVEPMRLQDNFEGIVSYKRDGMNGRIVCFHGKPKPWEVE